MTTAAEKYQHDHAALTSKLSGMEDCRRELVQKRADFAYSAHVGDAAAKKELDRTMTALLLHEQQVDSLRAAIAEVEARLRGAQEEEAVEVRRTIAAALENELATFRSIPAEIDAAFSIIAEKDREWDDSLRRIHALQHQLGVASFPSFAQVDSLGRRCMLTGVNLTRWKKDFPVLSPSERRSFSDTVAVWIRSIRQQLAPYLAAPDEEEEAA